MEERNLVRGPIGAAGRAEGAFAIEYLLVLMAAMSLLLPVAEFYRLSMFDQALARATYEGARAAAADPASCGTAVIDAFNNDGLAAWLFDRNDDNRIGMLTLPLDPHRWPTGSATEEAHVSVVADEDLFDGVDWEVTGCGAPGTDGWILVRSRIVVRPLFAPLQAIWPNGFRRQHESWARNQT